MILFGNINKGLQEVQATKAAVLVDVREADEFRSGHIPGAVNIPLSRITSIPFAKTPPLFLYGADGQWES